MLLSNQSLNGRAVTPTIAETQPYGATAKRPIALQRVEPIVEMLNQNLADALVLRDLYKKHRWQVSGPGFCQLQVLFDRHYRQLDVIADLFAERVQILGGITVAMGLDVCEMTRIPRPPRGREAPPEQLERLLAGHEMLIGGIRRGARLAINHFDDATSDLLIGSALRINERQVWFLSEHLAAISTSERA